MSVIQGLFSFRTKYCVNSVGLRPPLLVRLMLDEVVKNSPFFELRHWMIICNRRRRSRKSTSQRLKIGYLQHVRRHIFHFPQRFPKLRELIRDWITSHSACLPSSSPYSSVVASNQLKQQHVHAAGWQTRIFLAQTPPRRKAGLYGGRWQTSRSDEEVFVMSYIRCLFFLSKLVKEK